jgi:hypothetical protein
MKGLKFAAALVLLFVSISVGAQNKQVAQKVVKQKIEVYYFHYTARCATCMAIEAETKSASESLYPEMAKGGEIVFQSINMDDAEGDALASKMKVSGKAVLLIKGNKRFDITNEAFLYARTSPDKYREIVKSKIDALKN